MKIIKNITKFYIKKDWLKMVGWGSNFKDGPAFRELKVLDRLKLTKTNSLDNYFCKKIHKSNFCASFLLTIIDKIIFIE